MKKKPTYKVPVSICAIVLVVGAIVLAVLHSVKPNSSTPFLKVIWDISIGDQQIADTIEYRFKKYYDIRPKIF